jgi:hypothetical protein
MKSLEITYPSPFFTLTVIDDNDKNLTSCFLCQMKLLYSTNIVIGAHGAGLLHSIAMETGNVMISTVPKVVMYPPLSYFDMWASALGFHHYMHTPSIQNHLHTQLNGTELVSEINYFIHEICKGSMDVMSPYWCDLYKARVNKV